jgi:hypothetical protein
VLPTGGADVGLLVASSGYLLIDCAPNGSSQVLYVLAAGSKAPTSLALTGADADFPGDANGGQTWPGGFVMSGTTLYLCTSQQLGIGSSNGVIAINMATGEPLWTHTVDQANTVTLLTADAAGVTVVAETASSATMETLSAQNGTPTDDYALTSAEAGMLPMSQWTDAPPFALQAGSQIALAFPAPKAPAHHCSASCRPAASDPARGGTTGGPRIQRGPHSTPGQRAAMRGSSRYRRADRPTER